MPSSDYTNAVGGGLKLKGAKDAGVKKHKKKKPKADVNISEAADSVKEQKEEQEAETSTALQKALAEEEDAEEDAASVNELTKTKKDAGLGAGAGKTEAQRKHEEIRRKRLDDRLKREGVKTHKERVEELNKYLSGLSEHHDMPRIGPG